MRAKILMIALAITTIQTSSIVLNVSEAHAKNESARASEAPVDSRFFNEKEKRLIEDFFDSLRRNEASAPQKTDKKSKKGLPPGLAKKKELPPGLAKRLERNGTLPPGLAKRDLPHDLRVQLPDRSSIFERIIHGDDILLIEKGTEIILDILRGAARK